MDKHNWICGICHRQNTTEKCEDCGRTSIESRIEWLNREIDSLIEDKKETDAKIRTYMSEYREYVMCGFTKESITRSRE